jgi:hypothetical protein
MDKAGLIDNESVAAIPTYAALLNERVVVPSNNTPYFAVEQHFFFDCMQKLLLEVHVDDSWYLAKYPDVKAAIDEGIVNNPKQHYARFGFYEHRLPYEIQVEADWYLSVYSDVGEAIRKNSFDSAAEHFELVGYREGRLPFPGFSLKFEN